MAHSVYCITNTVPDLRSCVVRGAHKPHCDGWARRYDPETGQTNLAYRMDWIDGENVRILVECGGCLPRTAKGGSLLCDAHHLKLEHALEVDDDGRLLLVDLVTHMWSIESGGVRDDNDRVASAFGSQWPLSESHILANMIYAAMGSAAVAFANDARGTEFPFSAAASILDGFQVDLDVDIVGILVRDLIGYLADQSPRAIRHARSAEQIVRLIDVVQHAMTKFPLVDLEHRVPFVRCPACARMTMTWKPPLMERDDVRIACERCGHVESQEWLEEYIATVKTDPRRRA